MGKKDKFIDKANSQKFHLMHRSLTDEAHANYEVPSNFVLVPASTVSALQYFNFELYIKGYFLFLERGQ